MDSANRNCDLTQGHAVQELTVGHEYQGTITAGLSLLVSNDLTVNGGTLALAANAQLQTEKNLVLGAAAANATLNAGTNTQIRIAQDFVLGGTNTTFNYGSSTVIFDGEEDSNITRPGLVGVEFYSLAADKRNPLARIGAPEGEEQNIIVNGRLGVEGQDFVGVLRLVGEGHTLTLRDDFNAVNLRTKGGISATAGSTIRIAHGTQVSFSGEFLFSAIGSSESRVVIQSENGSGTHYSLDLGGIVALRYVDVLDLSSEGLRLSGAYSSLAAMDEVLIDGVEEAAGSAYLNVVLQDVPASAALQGIQFGMSTAPDYVVVVEITGEALSLRDLGLPASYMENPSRLLRVDAGDAVLFAATAQKPSFPYVFRGTVPQIGMVELQVFNVVKFPYSYECSQIGIYSNRKIICDNDFLTIEVQPWNDAPVPVNRTAIPAVVVEWVGRDDVPPVYLTADASKIVNFPGNATFSRLEWRDIKARHGLMRIFVVSDGKDDAGHVGLLSVSRQRLLNELTPVVDKRLVPFYGHHEKVDASSGVPSTDSGDSVHAVAGIRQAKGDPMGPYPTPVIMQGCEGKTVVHKLEWGNGLAESAAGIASSPRVSDKLTTIEHLPTSSSVPTTCAQPRFIVGPVLDTTRVDLRKLPITAQQVVAIVQSSFPLNFYYNDLGGAEGGCFCDTGCAFPPHLDDEDCDGLGKELENQLGLCWNKSQSPAGLDCSAGSLSRTSSPYPVVRPSDTDQDGLLDGWEVLGVRRAPGETLHNRNADGHFQAELDLPLPTMGANPRVRDYFIQTNYWESPSWSSIQWDHSLPQEAIDAAVEFYTKVDIPNPDPTVQGVALHIVKQVGNGCWGDICDQDPGTWECDDGRPFAQQSNAVKATGCGRQHPAQWRRRLDQSMWGIVHWFSLHGSASTLPNGQLVVDHNAASGNACQPGVSGSILMPSTAGTANRPHDGALILIHEMGHTFGLGHGGGDSTNNYNCKPNYYSIMNYLYSYDGYYGAQGRCLDHPDFPAHIDILQFSDGANPPLDETSIVESFGINGNLRPTPWLNCMGAVKEGSGVPDYFGWQQATGAANWDHKNGISTVSMPIGIVGEEIGGQCKLDNLTAVDGGKKPATLLQRVINYDDLSHIMNNTGAGLYGAQYRRFGINSTLVQDESRCNGLSSLPYCSRPPPY